MDPFHRRNTASDKLEAPYLSYIQNYTWVPSVKTSLQDSRLSKSSAQYNTVSWSKK